MKFFLVLDTTIQGAACGICALSDDAVELKGYQAKATHSGSAQGLTGLVSESLAQANVARADVCGVVMGHGPGSFTGIRVGLAFVGGLLAGHGKLLCVGMSALDAAALRLRRDLNVSGTLTLFLPATKTTGFASRVAPGSVSSFFVDIGPDGGGFKFPTDEPSAQNFVTGKWESLTAAAAEQRAVVQEREVSEVSRLGIYGMAEGCLAAWPKDFGRVIPPPQYLRRSTVEEKMLSDEKK